MVTRDFAQAVVLAVAGSELMDQTMASVQQAPDAGYGGGIGAMKAAARRWDAETRAAVLGARQDIESYATTFKDETNDLLVLAGRVRDGDGRALEDARAELATLRRDIDHRRDEVDAAVTAMNALRTQVTAADAQLGADVQKLQAAAEAQRQVLDEQQRRLADVSYKLDQERSASGVALRILEAIFTMGVSELINDQRRLEGEVWALQSQVAQTQKQLSSLYGAAATSSTIKGVADRLGATLTDLDTLWQKVQANVDALTGDEVEPGSAFLEAQVKALRADWEAVLSALARV